MMEVKKLLIVAFLIFPMLLSAQSITKESAIGNYLYNFSQYTQWSSIEGDNFSIHVVSDNNKIQSAMEKLYRGQNLKGKSIGVTQNSSGTIPIATQVVFIDKEMLHLYRKIYRQVEGKPILLVSHDYGNKRLVMINLLQSKESKLRFEINKANIINQNLKVDPKIIFLGGTELDVAQLYKSARDSLFEKEEELDSLQEKVAPTVGFSAIPLFCEEELDSLQEKVAQLDREIDSREKELESTRMETVKFQKEAKYLKLETDVLKENVELQKIQLIDERLKLNRLEDSLNKLQKEHQETQKEIVEKESLVSSLSGQIEKKQNRLKDLEKEVTEKIVKLEASEDKISQQQTYMLILSGFSTVFLFLIGIIALLLYRKQKSNLKLRETQALLVNQAKMAQMGEMLTMIAHHWRQPLNRVGVIVQNLEDDYNYGELKKDTVSKASDDVIKILKEISATISRFTYTTTGQKTDVSFDVNREIEKVIGLFAPEFKDSKIVVEFDRGEEITLFGDPKQFGDVLIGILKNAEEALLSKNIDKRYIKLSADTFESKAKIVIWDNGDTIPEDILLRIFEPFYTTKGITTKSGLGLYSAKLIIEREFNGEIEVLNRENGVECSIKIPIKAKHENIG